MVTDDKTWFLWVLIGAPNRRLEGNRDQAVAGLHDVQWLSALDPVSRERNRCTGQGEGSTHRTRRQSTRDRELRPPAERDSE
jgi:hypothetical protein